MAFEGSDCLTGKAGSFLNINTFDIKFFGKEEDVKIFLKNAWQYVIIVIWFSASIVFFEYMLNRGNTDLTKEMSEASLPIVFVRRNGHDLNRMYGYTKDMDYSLIRDGITPLEQFLKCPLFSMLEKANLHLSFHMLLKLYLAIGT